MAQITDPNALIATLVSRVAAGGAATEPDMWERIATAFHAEVGRPLDRADAYHSALASAVFGAEQVRQLCHD